MRVMFSSRMGMRHVAAALMAALLAGCSSDKGASNDLRIELLGSLGQIREGIATIGDGPPPKIALSAEQVANLPQAVVQVNPEILGGSAFLGRIMSRSDSGSGTLEVWNSPQGEQATQITLRNGVLIGSRGFGRDVISADADVTIKAVRARGNSRGTRSYVISNGDVTSTEYEFSCQVTVAGEEEIIIAERVFKTDLLRERCVGGPDGTMVLNNAYWVQKSTNLIRKSRQWLGPQTGYFEILLVKN